MHTPLLRNESSKTSPFRKTLVALFVLAAAIFALSWQARNKEEAALAEVEVGTCEFGDCQGCVETTYENGAEVYKDFKGGPVLQEPKDLEAPPTGSDNKRAERRMLYSFLKCFACCNGNKKPPKDLKALQQEEMNEIKKIQAQKKTSSDVKSVPKPLPKPVVPLTGKYLDDCTDKTDDFCEGKLICIKGGVTDGHKFGGCKAAKTRGPPWNTACCDYKPYTKFILVFTNDEFRMKNRAQMVTAHCADAKNNCKTVETPCATMAKKASWKQFIDQEVKANLPHERVVVIFFAHGSKQKIISTTELKEHAICKIKASVIIKRMNYVTTKLVGRDLPVAPLITSACYSGYLRIAVAAAGYPFPIISTEGTGSHYSRNMKHSGTKRSTGWGNGASDLALRVIALDVSIYKNKNRIGWGRQSTINGIVEVSQSSGSDFIDGARAMVGEGPVDALVLPTPGYKRLTKTGSLKLRYKPGLNKPGFIFRDYGLDPKYFMVRIREKNMCHNNNAQPTTRQYQIGNADIELHYFMDPIVCPSPGNIRGYQVLDANTDPNPTKFLLPSDSFTCSMAGAVKSKVMSITLKKSKCSTDNKATNDVFIELVYEIKVLLKHQMHETSCAKHGDCKDGEYCYDWGRYTTGEWSSFGQCSDVAGACCEDGDADPIDQATDKCPPASGCASEQPSLSRSSSTDSQDSQSSVLSDVEESEEDIFTEESDCEAEFEFEDEEDNPDLIY